MQWRPYTKRNVQETAASNRVNEYRMVGQVGACNHATLHLLLTVLLSINQQIFVGEPLRLF